MFVSFFLPYYLFFSDSLFQLMNNSLDRICVKKEWKKENIKIPIALLYLLCSFYFKVKQRYWGIKYLRVTYVEKGNFNAEWCDGMQGDICKIIFLQNFILVIYWKGRRKLLEVCSGLKGSHEPVIVLLVLLAETFFIGRETILFSHNL